jgi:hypothetical protein
MFKKTAAAVGASLIFAHAYAADLFPDGNLREIKAGEYLQVTDTVGGYPIVLNDGNWKFVTGKGSTSGGNADSVKMAYVLMDFAPVGGLLARQSLSVTTASGNGAYWSGSPCAPGHLVIRNKGRGRQDNCMTIDTQTVNLGATPTTFFNIALTNSGSAGRYYRINLILNAEILGFRGTSIGDWTEEEVKAAPYKKEAIDKLTGWAELIQDGSIKAFDFSKPQDVYTNVPSLMTLLPVPEDLVGQKRSLSFVSSVEHLRHVNSIKSIAYARYEDFKGAWGSVVDQPSQEAADLAALAKCENTRTTNRPDVPPCTVYRLTDGKRVSDTYSFRKTGAN